MTTLWSRVSHIFDRPPYEDGLTQLITETYVREHRIGVTVKDGVVSEFET